MTDPNPLKQAAEEAKARKLAEVSAQEAAARERGPIEEFEVITPPTLLKTSWANLDVMASQRDISVSSAVRDVWWEWLQNEPAGESWVAVVRARAEGTIPMVMNRLESAGLMPAGLRELLTYEWHPSQASETLWALGSRAKLGPALMTPYRIGHGPNGYVLGHTNALAADTRLTNRHTFLVRLDSKTIDSIAKARQPRP